MLGVLDALTGHGVPVWVAGGWGVDALAGLQTREHADLDLAIDASRQDLALRALGALGFEVTVDWLPTRVALTDEAGRAVDLHPVMFEASGRGLQAALHGQDPFEYPAASFVTGAIGGRPVPCLSADLQVRFHGGYEQREVDRHDLAVLAGLAALAESQPRTDYDAIGRGYAEARRADPRIATRIDAALGQARTVLNVGAGTGNYEPADRRVVAVEPAPTMLAQRPAGAAPVLRGVAEALPFRTDAFDAALAVLTVHHWPRPAAGVTELRRVARRQVVLHYDPEVADRYWLLDYFPEARALPSEVRAPAIDDLVAQLDGATVEVVEVPADCTDGFAAAYWNRPEAYLDDAVRAGISTLALLPADCERRGVERLSDDLASGAWDDRHGHLRSLRSLDAGYRLLIAG